MYCKHTLNPQARPLLVALLMIGLIDLILIIASALITSSTDSWFFSMLNLGVENNAAVWWSAATLMLAAVMIFDAAFRHPVHRTVLLIISTLLAVLSLDEMGSLHERLFSGSYWSYVPYGLAGGLLFLYAVSDLYRDRVLRPLAVLLFIGFTCFASVVLQEFLEHNLNWPLWLQGLRTAVEEGVELLGTGLCLLAGAKLLGLDKNASLVLPIRCPGSRPFVMVTALVATVLSVALALIVPSMAGFPGLGNPALWCASVAWLVLALELVRGRTWREFGWIRVAMVAMALLLSLMHALYIHTLNDPSKLAAVDLLSFVLMLMLLARTQKLPVIRVLVAAAVWLLLGILSTTGSTAGLFMLASLMPLMLIDLHAGTWAEPVTASRAPPIY